MKRHAESLFVSLPAVLVLSIILFAAKIGAEQIVRAQDDVFTNIAYPIHLSAPAQEIRGGSIVSLTDTGYVLAHMENDEDMIGVISDEPGLFYQGDVVDQNAYLVNGGTTYILVNTTNGAIVKGDHITSSETPGVGVKAMRSGKVIGRALENYDGTSVGKISANIKPEMFEIRSESANLVTSPVSTPSEWWYVLALVIIIFSAIAAFLFWKKTQKS